MKTNNSAFAFILLLLFAVGCGGNPSVTGKVSFPDGTPMGVGLIHFESATTQAVGALRADGTFTMTAGDLPGVPEGTYKVYFSGYGPVYGSTGTDANGSPIMEIISNVECPIDKKYLNATSSDLTCEVKGKTKQDIVVEPAK